jgi:hypothetical protein
MCGRRDPALAARGAEPLSEVARSVDVDPVAGVGLADAKAACEVGADGHSEAGRDACAPAGDDTGVAAVKVKGPAASARKVEAGSRAEFLQQAADYAGGAGDVAGRACREDLADSPGEVR